MATSLPEAIDLPVIATLMKRVEMLVHRGGWSRTNAHMQLFILHEHAKTRDDFARLFQPVIRDGKYTISQMLRGQVFDRTPMDPHEQLRGIALHFAYDHESTEFGVAVENMRRRIRVPGVIGLVSAHEVWGRTIPVEELAAESNWADHPDAEEARLVICIDAWDRAHTLARQRGHKPEITMDSTLRGDVSTSLRILMDMIYERNPPLESFDEHYPLLVDAVRKSRKIREEDLPRDPSLDHREASPADLG